MRARGGSTPEGIDTRGLCIDSTTHKQQAAQLQLPFKSGNTAQAPSPRQHSPLDQQLQQPKQEPSIPLCTLAADGTVSQSISVPAAFAASNSAGQAAGALQSGKQPLTTPAGTTAAQQHCQQNNSNEALIAAALASQSCSVPSDLEIMDQLFDELVMLDPNFNKGLANAPVIQFETFIASQDTHKAANQQADDVDMHRTFLTACEVPESQSDEQPSSNSTPGPVPRFPACPTQRRPGMLGQPEVAASTDLFTWKASSQSGSGDGRARLHSLNLDPTIQQQSLSGGTGVRWADGGYVSTSGAANDHSPINHRMLAGHHSTSGSAAPGFSLPLAHLPKQQDPLAAAALLSSQQFQQQPPSMNELKYQMDDIRKLHLSTVTTVSPALANLRAQQLLQQQQQAANRSGVLSAGNRSASPTRDSLPTGRMSAGSPKWPPQSARQQQASWQELPVLQTRTEPQQGQAVQKSFVGMKASAPSWKRK